VASILGCGRRQVNERSSRTELRWIAAENRACQQPSGPNAFSWKELYSVETSTDGISVLERAHAKKVIGHAALRSDLRSQKFYKGRSQEKTPLLRLDFFLLRSPLDGARSVLTYRAMCPVDSVVGFSLFSRSGFHRFLATKPVSSETSKAERWSNLATIVLFGTRGP